MVSANPSFHHNFTFQLGSSNITPSTTARNFEVVIDDKLKFSDHIAKTAQSCRFALFNIKKIGSFLSEHASQLLVQALVLSKPDYCNALLAGLPASSIKPLQLIQNAAARLIFNEQKRTHVTPLFINLLWPQIAACIKFKALMFAYKTSSGSAPLYLNSLLQTYVPLEACVQQVNVALLFIPKRHKITFTDFYINCSLLPNSIQQSLAIFKNQLKHISSIFIFILCFIFIYYIYFLKPCYVFCIKLTETCYSTSILLLFC